MRSTVPEMPCRSTGCGLISMKSAEPEESTSATAGPKRTVPRRLRYQYAASRPVPSSTSPVTVERNGTAARRGSIPSSAPTTASRISSTCAECEA